MGNRLIGIGSSSQSWPLSSGRSSKIDENSIVYVMATLPGENLGQNQAVLNEFHPSTCNLQPGRSEYLKVLLQVQITCTWMEKANSLPVNHQAKMACRVKNPTAEMVLWHFLRSGHPLKNGGRSYPRQETFISFSVQLSNVVAKRLNWLLWSGRGGGLLRPAPLFSLANLTIFWSLQFN